MACFWQKRRVLEVCDICFGKKKVVVILGNDDQVTIDCSACELGFDAPLGRTRDHKWISGAEKKLITEVETRQDISGEKVEYRSDGWCLKPEDVFNTKEEAEARAEIICKDYQYEQDTKAIYLKKDKTKNYAWNAGYHLRNAKKLRQQAEDHDRKAILCKGKIKDAE